MYNFKQLLTFTTVVETGSFSMAAKKLYMTQPAVSAQIKSLETGLDLLLIERNDRDILLTEAGEIFNERAMLILKQVHSLSDDMTIYKQGIQSRLKIASSTIPGEYLLPNYIQNFKKTHHDVSFCVEISDSSEVLKKIIEGITPLGIIGYDASENDIICLPFFSEKLKLVASINFEIKTALTLKQVLTHPIILREEGSGTRKVIYKYLEAEGLHPENLNHNLVLGSTKAIVTAVEAGMGLSWISENALDDALKLGKIKIVNENYSIQRQFYIITNRKRTMTPLAQAFMNFLNIV